jgi:hypothetical protein
MKATKRLGTALAILLLLYVAPYIGLSLGGRFEPMYYSLGERPSCRWIPYRFTRGLGPPGCIGCEWNRGVVLFYYPLWYIDYQVWHTDAQGERDSELRRSRARRPPDEPSGTSSRVLSDAATSDGRRGAENSRVGQVRRT